MRYRSRTTQITMSLIRRSVNLMDISTSAEYVNVRERCTLVQVQTNKILMFLSNWCHQMDYNDDFTHFLFSSSIRKTRSLVFNKRCLPLLQLFVNQVQRHVDRCYFQVHLLMKCVQMIRIRSSEFGGFI